MTEFTFQTAWLRNDPAQADDAKAFWAEVGKLAPHLIEQRTKELAAIVYSQGKVVAVLTAELAFLPGLRARFAVAQIIVHADYRRQSLSARTFAFFLTILESWSAEHPEEKVMGIAAVVEAKEYAEKQREPVWPDWGLNMVLTGYTAKNQQIRVSWFRHARV